MKTSAVLIALGLLALGPVVAQQPGPQASSSAQFNITPNHCSVADMHVRQGSSLQMRRAADGNSTPVMTPTITLKPKNGRPLTGATLTVHGSPAASAAVPLAGQRIDKDHPQQSKDLTTTVQVTLRPAGDGGYSGELTLSGFGYVKSVDLKSVTYADGSTWKVPDAGECSVKPDPLLLISER
jgi:hypothetical protein